MLDHLIKGGTVIDGLRTPRYKADIAIKDGIVAQIGSIAAPQAPPDNVVVLGAAQWHELFDAVVAARLPAVARAVDRVAGVLDGR